MDDILAFLLSYKDYFLYGSLIIISILQLLILIIKKPVIVSDNIKEYILEKLPILIIAAESQFKVGSDKFDFVVNTLIQNISEDFNLSSKLVLKRFRTFISTNIEKILLTPKSKGGI